MKNVLQCYEKDNMKDVNQPEELQNKDRSHDEEEGRQAVTKHHGGRQEVQSTQVQKLCFFNDAVPEMIDLQDSGEMDNERSDHEDS